MKKKKDALPKHIWDVFYRFKKMKKGELIENGSKKIGTKIYIYRHIKNTMSTPKKVYFSHLTIKHMAEKNILGEKLLKITPKILLKPDEIRHGIKKDRLIFIKNTKTTSHAKNTAVVIESKTKNTCIVVTIFPTNKKYLEKFELLWRTPAPNGVPSMRQHFKEVARGKRFPAHTATQSSQSTKSSISKLKQKGQE
ncbi:MAG: hypothetical protein K9L98_01405 [Candidatus Pacebacteria bacterium]|nr:hypothetical protein [Candidatus Paceibacterota bacterium]MCF7862649.1 hypothetical protein [Candidatus Paceibacterota bacterium]